MVTPMTDLEQLALRCEGAIRAIPAKGMSDRAVYLGDGVWWQLSNEQLRAGMGYGLPQKIRPWPTRTRQTRQPQEGINNDEQ
jgi:hypothetical protein